MALTIECEVYYAFYRFLSGSKTGKSEVCYALG
jgi:hypothetical protein